ncbi:helix-turn-helix transcriptional regulator [Halopiger aswanensis]|uniref:DUF7343 domain-containing protein n=1 Tax=Halopiger aswanensis TaxID=148449 RepID=A0A419W0X6_9EURY|nr:MarR family transcriptional regulator [Halopiger aswanensis]RKD89133.1 hypothetical protein ATJ93_3959 [Halopiger aswanensis]
MASTVKLRARIAHGSASQPTDATRATIRRNDVHAAVSRPADQFGVPVSWLRPLELPTVWEQALLAVLFLLISGLIALRLVEALDRDLEAAFGPLFSGPDGGSDERDQSGDTRHTHEERSSPTTDHRGYERYLSPETPPELLSDEGKVVRLLVANGGEIRQHRITEETGWSKSKVSRICSQMHADGVVEKESVGRENVITLSATESTGTDDCDDPGTAGDVENPIP